MKRNTAIRLYQFLFLTQIIGLGVGMVKTVSMVSSGLYKYLPASAVGFAVGIGLAILWFHQLKQAEGTSEEQWNRIWHISPPNKV